MNQLLFTFEYTGSFLQNALVISRCVPNFEVFDSNIDATDYAPAGHTVRSGERIVTASTYIRD